MPHSSLKASAIVPWEWEWSIEGRLLGNSYVCGGKGGGLGECVLVNDCCQTQYQHQHLPFFQLRTSRVSSLIPSVLYRTEKCAR